MKGTVGTQGFTKWYVDVEQIPPAGLGSRTACRIGPQLQMPGIEPAQIFGQQQIEDRHNDTLVGIVTNMILLIYPFPTPI
jgi:hypothetical protein